MKKNLLIVGLGVVSLISLVAAGVFFKNQSDIHSAVSGIEKVVSRDFNDPESAKFRNIRLYAVSGTIADRVSGIFDAGFIEKHNFTEILSMLFYDRDGFELCGEVNAKNKYGAYVGYRVFHSDYIGGSVDSDGDASAKGLCDIQEESALVYKGD